MQVMGFILFVSIFSGICFGGNLYILWRFFSLFHLKRCWWFWVIVSVLAVSYVGGASLERTFPCGLSRWLLKAASVWLGTAWLALVILLTHDLLRPVFRYPTNISRWVVLSLIVSVSLYAFINGMRIEVKQVQLPAPVTMKIAQLSDVHVGSVSVHHLERLVEKVNQLAPDVVLITGDLIDPQGEFTSSSLAALNRLTIPVYWVTGNHERYAGLDRVMDLLASTPVVPLRNQVVEFGGIQLIGIDDSDDRRQVQVRLSEIEFDADRYSILMYHQPEGFDVATEAGVNLMLSGHTHNGQIAPFNYVVGLRFEYLMGLYEKNGAVLYVSPGSGTWGPPMRLGSRNEITLIHLQKD